jgi:putrescine aminotransferase
MIGLDFTPNGNSLTRPLRKQTAAMMAMQMLHRHRIISLYTFTNANVVRLAPPLNVAAADLDAYVDALEEVLDRYPGFAGLALSTIREMRRRR